MSYRVKAARGKADENQKALKIRALALGFVVVDLSPVGKGVPDLLISTPLEMFLVEVKRLDVKGLANEFKDTQKRFYEQWEGKGKDMLVWYEQADVDLLFLMCDRANHFHGQVMHPEAHELREGRAVRVLSPQPKRRGSGHCLPSNISRIPGSVQSATEGFITSDKLLAACEVSRLILSGRKFE